MKKILIRGNTQEHQRWQEDVCPCLTARMGTGGNNVPVIVEVDDEEDTD